MENARQLCEYRRLTILYTGYKVCPVRFTEHCRFSYVRVLIYNIERRAENTYRSLLLVGHALKGQLFIHI